MVASVSVVTEVFTALVRDKRHTAVYFLMIAVHRSVRGRPGEVTLLIGRPGVFIC